MKPEVHSTRSSDYSRFSCRKCPVCDGDLMRIPRRTVDRLWSLVVPVLRYRCGRFSCQWQGNLPGDASSATAAADGGASGYAGPLYESPQKESPVFFIASVAFAVVGVALVVVITMTDLLPFDEIAAAGSTGDATADSGGAFDTLFMRRPDTGPAIPAVPAPLATAGIR